jgi:hypothetical protein
MGKTGAAGDEILSGPCGPWQWEMQNVQGPKGPMKSVLNFASGPAPLIIELQQPT